MFAVDHRRQAVHKLVPRKWVQPIAAAFLRSNPPAKNYENHATFDCAPGVVDERGALGNIRIWATPEREFLRWLGGVDNIGFDYRPAIYRLGQEAQYYHGTPLGAGRRRGLCQRSEWHSAPVDSSCRRRIGPDGDRVIPDVFAQAD